MKVRGQVEDDLALLGVEIELSLLVPEGVWVPLGIDSQIVSTAREGERELELRFTGERQWEGPPRGGGAAPTPDRPQASRSRSAPTASAWSWRSRRPLPPTWSSDVPRAVHDVELGSGESIGKSLLPGGKGTRLAPHLAAIRPGGGVERRGEFRVPPPPLLTAQVEIAINVDAESVITQSSWAVRCVRGMARKLEIRLDAQEVVSKLKLGDQCFGAHREQRPDDPAG